MSRDRKSALGVYLIDRLLDVKARRHGAREEKAEDVALMGRDLLADHHLAAGGIAEGALDGPVDAVMVGDGDDAQPKLDRTGHDHRRRRRSVAVRGVDVEVGGAVCRVDHDPSI